MIIGYVVNIPIIQFWTGIPEIIQQKLYKLSLTEYEWESQNSALWDTLSHAPLLYLKYLAVFIQGLVYQVLQVLGVTARSPCHIGFGESC